MDQRFSTARKKQKKRCQTRKNGLRSTLKQPKDTTSDTDNENERSKGGRKTKTRFIQQKEKKQDKEPAPKQRHTAYYQPVHFITDRLILTYIYIYLINLLKQFNCNLILKIDWSCLPYCGGCRPYVDSASTLVRVAPVG